VQQEVVLAMLAKEPSYGYQLRARMRQALGPLGDAMNDGQVYVTLTRMEKAGLVTSEQAAGISDRSTCSRRPASSGSPAGWRR
jgi:DNA-binding PadR family transcriptional regulator